MAAKFATGLVVGKFCPLHRGHEALIDHALAHCGHVVVLSYTRPEFARCAPARRLAWLRRRFPQVTAIVLDASAAIPANDAPAAEQHAFVAAVLRERAIRVDAVFTSEAYGEPFAQDLGRLQGAWAPEAGAVAHVPFDERRAAWPISGTAVRAMRGPFRDLLSPGVAADFVPRICILGGESTGKTTLARALSAALGDPWVHEYGRELWEAREGALQFEDLLDIAEVQVAREEEAACDARRAVVCDTSPLTTLFYSLETFGRADPRLLALSHREYDLVLLCADDFAFMQDGTRRDEAFRRRGQDWYRGTLAERGLAWTDVHGPIGGRVPQAIAAMERAGL